MAVIRDAVHGSIELNAFEEKIVDLPIVQRLRGLRQLAAAHLVFPSAQHTRFEHSLGTLYLTSRLCSHLKFSDERTSLLRLAGLLHDVGHAAFSHLSEPFLEKYLKKSHEQLAVQKLRENGVTDMISSQGMNATKLERLLLSKSKDAAIISGDLGTDRIDYLLRDSLFCGVAYSVVDAQRLLETMDFKQGALVVGEKGKVPAESLLVSRYLMFNSVYFHHTIRIAYEMLRKAMAIGLENKQISIQDLSEGTDHSALQLLLQNKNPLAQAYSQRKLFKRAYSLSISSSAAVEKFFANPQKAREKLEEEFRKKAKEESFALCLPQTHTKAVSVKILSNGKIKDLSQESSLSRALEQEKQEPEFILACAIEKKELLAREAEKFFASL